MATLAPGALLNLLEGMNTGAKPTGEHRSSLLQVADIVPAHLDHDSLWPTRGFFLKVSDSSHSVYASLPPDQDDAVLTNKLQLGQFVYVDMFEPGSPVPVIRGLKPIPGRHPLMGMPQELLSLTEIGRGRSVSVAPSSSSSSSSARRGSWGSRGKALTDSIRGPSPMSLKPIPSDFDRSSPASGRKTVSPVVRRGVRSSHAGGLLAKAEYKGEGAASTRRSSMTPASKFPRSRSVACDRVTILATQEQCNSTTNFGRSSPIRVDDDGQGNSSSKELVKPKSQNPGSSPPSLNLPGRLGILGKEAVQRREAAQKIALRALREASATETMVWSLKMFSCLTKHAKAEAPGTSFNQFLEFHRQMMQAVNDMDSIHAATTENSKDETLDLQQRGKVDGQEFQVLNDITGTSDQTSARRQLALHKSGKTPSNVASTPTKAAGEHNSGSNENKKPVTSCCSLTDTIKLGKEIKSEAGKWFMDFVEKALELGLQKSKGLTKGDVEAVSQALLIKVVNWIEVNQFDKSKQPLHPKAQLIARKLRIKMKNP